MKAGISEYSCDMTKDDLLNYQTDKILLSTLTTRYQEFNDVHSKIKKCNIVYILSTVFNFSENKGVNLTKTVKKCPSYILHKENEPCFWTINYIYIILTLFLQNNDFGVKYDLDISNCVKCNIIQFHSYSNRCFSTQILWSQAKLKR